MLFGFIDERRKQQGSYVCQPNPLGGATFAAAISYPPVPLTPFFARL
jgi:hypothetical protein